MVIERFTFKEIQISLTHALYISILCIYSQSNKKNVAFDRSVRHDGIHRTDKTTITI